MKETHMTGTIQHQNALCRDLFGICSEDLKGVLGLLKQRKGEDQVAIWFHFAKFSRTTANTSKMLKPLYPKCKTRDTNYQMTLQNIANAPFSLQQIDPSRT